MKRTLTTASNNLKGKIKIAGITHLTQFQAPALRGLVDESMELNYEPMSFVESFIGNETTYNTHFAYDVIQRSQHIAAMVGLGAEKPVIDRHATAKVMGEIAHFGLKDVVTIEELYAIAQARGNGEKSAMIDKLLNKSIDLVQALQLRIRVEKLKALAVGYNEYNKNGVKVELDYGIPDNHKVALSGEDAWDNADKDVIGDLLAWTETYRQSNGKKPDAILMTRKVFNSLTANTMIIAEAGRPEGAVRVSTQEVSDVLTRFGLPQITIVEEVSQQVKDVYTGEIETIETFPENRVVFASSGAGVFLTGPNPDDANFAPVTTLKARDEEEPTRSILQVAQSGFAILENPNLVFHADVVAP